MTSSYSTAPGDMQQHPATSYGYAQQPNNLPPLTMPHQSGMGDSSHTLQPSPSSQGSDKRSVQLHDRGLKIVSRVDNKRQWRFSLQVVQQPQRARMCGFGDKDRRPITPPPCVRLIVTDINTGKEVDVNEIDHCHYVISVDLWAEDGQKEVNLVRSTTSTPSISATTPASYAQLENSTPAYTNILPSHSPHSYQQSPVQMFAPPAPPAMMPGYAINGQYYQAAYPTTPQGIPPPMQQNGYGPPQQYFPEQFQHAMVPSQSPIGAYAPRVSYPGDSGMPRYTMGTGQPQGMFTRNLIGSLVSSAVRLTDPQDKIGIWFILQDLSVRTEGNFR